MMDVEKIVTAVVNQQLYEYDPLEKLIPAGEEDPYMNFNPQYHDIIDFQVRDHY